MVACAALVVAGLPVTWGNAVGPSHAGWGQRPATGASAMAARQRPHMDRHAWWAGGSRSVTGVTPAAGPCSMAHCDPRLSDDEQATIPTTGVSVTWALSTTAVVNKIGLGCSTAGRLAVCAGTSPTDPFSYGPAYVSGIDALTGHRLWTSGSQLNGTVVYGAPLIDQWGNSYVSDDNYLMSFTVAGVVRWKVPNPAGAAFFSFNLTSSGYLVGQGRAGPLVVADPRTGAVTGQLLMTDTVDGVSGVYEANNSVSVMGNRVYITTQFCPFTGCLPGTGAFTPGRLYAVDVVNGVPRVAWHWDYAGPSGASPLTILEPGGTTIYFDGAGLHQGDPHHPWLFALQDTSSGPQLLWATDMTASYGIPYVYGILASPARDPRGGLWVWVTWDPRLFRFDEMTGTLRQVLDVGALLNRPGYVPSACMSTIVNAGDPVMLEGAWKPGSAQSATYLLAVDLSGGRLLWQLAAGVGPASYFGGQFALAENANAAVMVAPRWDGVILGLRLW